MRRLVMAVVNVSSSTDVTDGQESYFGIRAEILAERGSLDTAREIAQQPRIWREAHAAVDNDRDAINHWLLPKLELPRLQVLFCGAGTSAFIGDTVAAWLRKSFDAKNAIDFQSVSTTDLVADPEQFLSDDRPTIIVSFARSGDSPESVATVELADQLLSQCYHLIFTCNPEGALAQYAEDHSSAYCLLMPEGTNDKGFAMTSSYSSMLVSVAAVFTPSRRQLHLSAEAAEKTIADRYVDIGSLASKSFDRLVVIGSGVLAGTAREGALKCLELAAGKLSAFSDTSLGFRHGPKIVVSSETVAVHMISADPYVRQYDVDLYEELRSEGHAVAVVELSPESQFSDEASGLDDVWLSLVYVVYCQILAFLNSWGHGVSADTPCPSGEVNRVVQGVTIHQFPGSGG